MSTTPTLKKTSRPSISRRGLVLVAAVGVLGVLSVMGLAFATVMRLEARAARNFTEAVRADFAARAGIEDAIARLRSLVRDGTEAPYDELGNVADWYTWRGTAGGGYKISFPANENSNCLDDDGDKQIDHLDMTELEENKLSYSDWIASSHTDAGDTYTLRVQDAASKINVNAGDNLGTILDNVCRIVGPPLVAADQRAIVPKWLTMKSEYRQLATSQNSGDVSSTSDFFYSLDNFQRPVVDNTGKAVFGDGYAVAGHRSRHGSFLSTEDVRNALTWIERGDGDLDGDTDGPECDTPEERMEVEAKFAALRRFITVDAWVDTDQIGYGKFEHIVMTGQRATKLIDRNATWNDREVDDHGELRGCMVAIVNGVGQGQLKTISDNTIDTLILSDSDYPGSEMRVPPNHESSYVIIGKDHRYDTNATQWVNQAKLYAKQPLSFHRAPVNVNTATDKVLTALVLGLQTNWGKAGYGARSDMESIPSQQEAHWHSLCPSVISVGRDVHNVFMTFDMTCPNDATLSRKFADQTLTTYGHPQGEAPFCFFCNYGQPIGESATAGRVSEAHYLAWQILKEREQTQTQDQRSDTTVAKYSNGHGTFSGWDDLYFRVFRPWERAAEKELSVPAPTIMPRSPNESTSAESLAGGTGSGKGHIGVARVCMANFNSNTDMLKFQPNIEWINRWGPNFTELYLPDPQLLLGAQQGSGMVNKDVKLRIRPGELLDKSDLNIGTTEFCFDSGGVFEVESVGRVYDDDGVVAEKKYAALIRVYDVWRESTQREFVAGTIMSAQGNVGTQTAGQIAVDQVTQEKLGGGSSTVRKSLCTYPEPIVPGDYFGPNGQPAPLALADRRGMVVKPAGYDGHIELATNMLMTNANNTPVDDEVGFFNSFTGQIAADFGKGDQMHHGYDQRDRNPIPIDEVGLLGAADSTEFDLTPVWDRQLGIAVEGEGKGGDLRPDGLYMGVTKHQPPPLDGSFEFDGTGNIDFYRGTVTMWCKPNWHHGTFRKATLPTNYISSPYERGSTVPIKTWSNWKCLLQDYTDGRRGGIGYVRDRFEHEFFNAALAPLDRNSMAWNWAQGFQMRKNGDVRNTTGDGDMPEGGGDGTSPFGAWHLYFENHGDQDFCCWLPGWCIPSDTKAPAADRNKPWYQMCPFRWFFMGFTWNYNPSHRDTFDSGWHCPYGQLREASSTDQSANIDAGGAYLAEPRAGSTPDKNLSLVIMGRPFIDTQRHWERELSTFTGDDEDEKLENWALDMYGTTYQWGEFPFGTAPPFRYFGINRAMPEGGHYYQRVCSGTYATIDEFCVSKRWRDPRIGGDSGFNFPFARRRNVGRYYFQKDRRSRPYFTSQTLYSSESMQSFTFTPADQTNEIELGSVRWYAFTPYYSLHIPGRSNYIFPYDSYFLDTAPTGSATTHVTQASRPGPREWMRGPQSRNSSQRGITVSVISGNSAKPTDEFFEYQDPEAWSPILAKGSRGGQHARSAPKDLKYRVRFGFSDDEYRHMNSDTICIDTPVFDDITITFMQRPKVLVWREVSE